MVRSKVDEKAALFSERAVEAAGAAVRSPMGRRHSEGGSARGGAKGGSKSNEHAALLGGGEHGDGSDEDDDLDLLEKGISAANDRNQQPQEVMGMGQEAVLRKEKREETALQKGKGEALLKKGKAVDLQEDNSKEVALLLEKGKVKVEMQEENGKEAALLLEENGKEAAQLPEQKGNEAMQQPANSATTSQLQEIPPFEQHENAVDAVLGRTTRPEWEGLEDSSSVKIFVRKAVREAQKREDDPIAMNNFILQAAKKAVKMNEVPPSRAHRAGNNDSESSETNRAKLVKDGLAEHQTLSKALYGMSFTFTIPVVVAKAASLLDKDKDNDETLKSMVLLMVCSFAIFTACHCYLLVYHFVHTVAPGVSISYHRTTSTLLGIMASCWFGVLTLSIPEQLYRSWFWYITGGFVLVNWALIIGIGWMRLVTEEGIMEED